MDILQRDAIVRRDGFACRACGRRTAGQVHHLLARGLGGSDDPHNLVTLCGRCHMLVSPIPVAGLMAYFGITEAELVVRKARVEVGIARGVLSRRPALHSWWKLLRPRAGRAWHPDEDATLLAEFEAGLPLEEVATRLGRGVFAVKVRLCKLGRVVP